VTRPRLSSPPFLLPLPIHIHSTHRQHGHPHVATAFGGGHSHSTRTRSTAHHCCSCCRLHGLRHFRIHQPRPISHFRHSSLRRSDSPYHDCSASGDFQSDSSLDSILATLAISRFCFTNRRVHCLERTGGVCKTSPQRLEIRAAD